VFDQLEDDVELLQRALQVDSINESIHLIKTKSNLNEDVDVIFAHIIIRKFKREALQLYETHFKKTKERK